ncbi:MAG: hypothetical protein N3C12_09085 [Candidatus Binatia bacterium]|nr:hypothetical protein [Candidatus Binatia bacterium]
MWVDPAAEEILLRDKAAIQRDVGKESRRPGRVLRPMTGWYIRTWGLDNLLR